MYRQIKVDKASKPPSLMALAIEAAAACYRFDPNDLFTYKRDIDDSQPNPGALTTRKFEISYVRKIPRCQARKLPERVSNIMTNRAIIISKLFKEFAMMIVNFDGIEELQDLNGVLGVSKLREKYFKYAQKMIELENFGARVKKGDELQKLLQCIKRERVLLKNICMNHGPENFFAGGDNPGVEYAVTTGLQGDDDHKNKNAERKVEPVLEDNDDDDDDTVLYGMICLS